MLAQYADNAAAAKRQIVWKAVNNNFISVKLHKMQSLTSASVRVCGMRVCVYR